MSVQNIKPGIYKHYKGSEYYVLGVAINATADLQSSSTGMVVYMNSSGKLFARDIAEFAGLVMVESVMMERFRPVDGKEEPEKIDISMAGLFMVQKYSIRNFAGWLKETHEIDITAEADEFDSLTDRIDET